MERQKLKVYNRFTKSKIDGKDTYLYQDDEGKNVLLDTCLYEMKEEGLSFYDISSSITCNFVFSEIRNDEYGLNGIPFNKGDVVVDIGGHVGIFSIYLAKKFPDITVYSCEPHPINLHHFKMNLELNEVKNVFLIPSAVSKDGRDLEMYTRLYNTGGNSAVFKKPDNNCIGRRFKVPSVSLDHLFKKFGLDVCKLLKIDCEGCEYEILTNTDILSKVEYLSGEFHMDDNLSHQGKSMKSLLAYCEKFVPKDKTNITITMEEALESEISP